MPPDIEEPERPRTEDTGTVSPTDNPPGDVRVFRHAWTPRVLICLVFLILAILFCALAVVAFFGWTILPPIVWLLLLLLLLFLLLTILYGLFAMAAGAESCTVSITGENCLCKGASKVFTAQGTPMGGGFQWSVEGDLTIVQMSGGQVTVKAEDDAEIATVKVRYNVGNSQAIASKQVWLSRVEEIDGPECVCIGEPATFTVRTHLAGCEGDVQWTDGTVRGRGAAFTTTFTTAGDQTVEAHCGDSKVRFDLEVSEIIEIQPDVQFLRPSAPVSFGRAANRWVATVPNAVVEFTAITGPCDCEDVTWTVTGPAAIPASGKGSTIRITFSAPGSYLVEARCGTSVKQKSLTFCDFKTDLEAAANYYGPSVDFTRVKVDYSGTLLGSSWVFHNDVSIADLENFRDRQGNVVCPSRRHYVHELGHVWEYQHGQLQITLGIVDQILNFLPLVNVYDYGGAHGVRNAVATGQAIDSFNREQQCEIFADDFTAKTSGAIAGQYASDLAALTAPALAAAPTP